MLTRRCNASDVTLITPFLLLAVAICASTGAICHCKPGQYRSLDTDATFTRQNLLHFYIALRD